MIIKNKIQSLLLLAVIFFMTACSGNKSGVIDPISPEVYWKNNSTVSFENGSATIIIKGEVSTQWSAEISQGGEWCSFSSTSKVLNKNGELNGELNTLYIYYSSNFLDKEREAAIVVNMDSQNPILLKLKQEPASKQNFPAFGSWGELPEYKKEDSYKYVTHYAKLNDALIRNYSICYDKTKNASLWVAYPMHNVYLGNAGRTDEWAYDPIIEQQYQVNCIESSFRGYYDRGHQIPSGDRQANKELNAQTFYMTNIVPQLNRLNQDMWGKLEGLVRNNTCSDTLFVVTGVSYEKNVGTTLDGRGKIIPLPSHFYKLLLRTKKGKTGKNIKDCADNELQSIGFWVEHKSYGDIQPPIEICTSIVDIEKRTGFKFFPNVSEVVKNQNDPSAWGIR